MQIRKTLLAATALVSVALNLAGTPPAMAQPGTARQAEIANKAYCADVLATRGAPAECHADIPRGQVSILPAQAQTGRAPFAAIASQARIAALVAGQRNLSVSLSITEQRKGMNSTSIDLDAAAVAELSRLDSDQKAETLLRAKAKRCENTLVETKCSGLPGK